MSSAVSVSWGAATAASGRCELTRIGSARVLRGRGGRGLRGNRLERAGQGGDDAPLLVLAQVGEGGQRHDAQVLIAAGRSGQLVAEQRMARERRVMHAGRDTRR